MQSFARATCNLTARHCYNNLRLAPTVVTALNSCCIHNNNNNSNNNTNNRSLCCRSMTTDSFSTWRVTEQADGKTYQGSEQSQSVSDLICCPTLNDDTDNSVLIRVTHSSLNYKDALSASGPKFGVTRKYPHTPGIDAAGYYLMTEDESSVSTTTDNKSSVLVTGYDLGMNTDGGFGEVIRVPKQWCICPNPFPTAKQAMIYGTAGLTAALCVNKLLTVASAKPSDGLILVTGASGGVGSVAVEVLSKLGFKVVAVSGKSTDDNQVKEFLIKLGAAEIVGRDALSVVEKKPLLKPTYAHAIDTVGGPPLVQVLKRIQPGGSVATCGNAAGLQLESLTVLPFILRGVNLLGVDSVELPLQQKLDMWNKLAGEWNCPVTEEAARDIGRHQLEPCLQKFLKGQSYGKIVLDHSLTKKVSKL